MIRKNISKNGATVRTLLLLMALVLASGGPALASGPTDFESFIKTREVLATLYFATNADALTITERNRLTDTMQQFRKAQKSGRMIRVEGFSSAEGDQEKNFLLSFFRARSVADIIEAEGLAFEIALTGYGDLRADSTDHSKERRVEVASYVKPVGIKRVKVVDNKIDSAILSTDSEQVRQKALKIDSYRVDQAIRNKVDDQGGFAEKRDKLDDDLQQPNLGKTREQLQEEDLERGYSLWRHSVVGPDKPQKVVQASSKDLKHGLTQSKESDDGLQGGYSQSEKGTMPESAPGVTMFMPAQSPVIDALMIEQAIMEKIGAEPTEPSAAVSRVDLNYQQ